MSVQAGPGVPRAEHGGRTFHFCSAHCKQAFEADPERFLGGDGSDAAPAAGDPDAEYTCPMHPEVVQRGPGTCPRCGMALEPVSGGAGDDSELRDMQRRLGFAALFTLPVFVLAMGGHVVPALRDLLAPGVQGWVELVLTTPVVAWAAWPLLARGAASVRTWNLNMFTLIGLGVAAAYGYSVLAVVAPGVFPPGFRDESGHVGVYFEAAAMIVTLVLVGQVLELRARHRTGAAIRGLLELAPATARRVGADGGEEEVPLERVQVGDAGLRRPRNRPCIRRLGLAHQPGYAMPAGGEK